MNSLNIAPIIIALCVAIQVPITFAVGLRRLASHINFGWDDDTNLMRKIRGHGNFVETVPITLIAITVAELTGMAQIWLIIAGTCLLAGRLIHYHSLVFTASGATLGRAVGMTLTFTSMIIPAVYLLYTSLN